MLDLDNYRAYCADGEYEFHGGFYDVSPVVLEVPYDGYWFLIVDSNDRRVWAEQTEVFD